MPVEYGILGPLEVRAGDRLLPIRGRKQRALLAVLLLHANEAVSRERLIEGLWDDERPATVASELRVYLSRLRQLLRKAGDGGALVRDNGGYRLRVESGALDLEEFTRLTSEGSEAEVADDPVRASNRFREALALWRGHPLAGLEDEPFAAGYIGWLDELRLSALERRITAELALGKHEELIAELEALVEEHPHRDRLRKQLMFAFYRAGRRVEALATYRQAQHKLATDFGLAPDHELRDLERAIICDDDQAAATVTNVPTP